MSAIRICYQYSIYCHHIRNGYKRKYRHSTRSFDTFNPTNYTWEGEDFDYDGGQFIDNPQTNAYYGLPAVDGCGYASGEFCCRSSISLSYQSAGLPGEGNGMATEVNGDLPRVTVSRVNSVPTPM